MATSIVTTQTTEVKITPALKRKLLTKLKTYQINKQQADALKHANDKIKQEIETLFADAGEFGALQAGIKVEGFSTKHVSGTTKSLDKKRLLEMGVTTAMLEEATVEKPKRSYLDVRCPGEKDDE